MIEILFPQGCYGTYLARSLYNYTNLRVGDYKNFVFDNRGSSHIHRQNLDAQTKIVQGHRSGLGYTSPLLCNNAKNIITILPLNDHNLDYYNNQYLKVSKGQLTNHIISQLPISEINRKLSTGWNYNESLTVNTPRWILREFLSLWIVNLFNNEYFIELYNKIPSKIKINTQDIITNIEKTIINICQAFDLTVNVLTKDILINHQNFIKAQHYHNSQINCDTWVRATIDSSISINNPCQTIFDEAYMQHSFRIAGYEIKCDGLNIMPTTSLEMKDIIYKI